MPQTIDLGEEVLRAFVSLPAKDQDQIKLDVAGRVIGTLLTKLDRVPDRGSAIRYSLSECHVGKQGPEKKRREVYGAYWRLARKVVNARDRQLRSPKMRRT